MGPNIPHNALEDLKSGNFNSSKYNTVQVTGYKYPHIIVFRNELPDLTKLSTDRYLIAEIIDLKLKVGLVREFQGIGNVVFFKQEESNITKFIEYELNYRKKFIQSNEEVNSPQFDILSIPDFHADANQINDANKLKRKLNCLKEV